MARYRNIDGVETVERVLRGISRRAAEKVANALNQGADEIAKRAAQMVPVDEGELRDTIAVDRSELRAVRAGRRVAVTIVAGTSRERALAAYRQEFGRAPGPGDHPGHAAQPFMFPAYWSLRRRVRQRIANAVRAAAREAARGAR